MRGAIAACREAIRLKPDLAEAHSNLGNALRESGDVRGAIAAWREAIRLKPDFAAAHSNLGNALVDSGDVPRGDCGAARGDRPQARLGRGPLLPRQRPRDSGDVHRAIAAQRGDPLEARPRHGPLQPRPRPARLGRRARWIAAYREAIRLKPDAEAHYNLGIALGGSGDVPGAIAVYREAIRLKPDFAEAHCNLGLALRGAGAICRVAGRVPRGAPARLEAARLALPVGRVGRQAERLAALADRLPAVLAGTARPADAAERLAFAQMAYDAKRHAAAARLWSEALAADPKLGDDREAQHRYNAACAAALAGCRPGEGRTAAR